MAQSEQAGTKIQVVIPPEDMDLLHELNEEVHRRKQSGDLGANRSALILEYVRAGRSKATSKKR